MIFVLVAQCGLAGTGSGKILEILAHEKNTGAAVIMFKTESNSSKATCSTTDDGQQWAFSLGNDIGEAMYTLLLSAQAQDIDIYVKGTNDCNAWHDRERPLLIRIQ